MRPLWNNLTDPSLHLLAIALFMVYLAFGRSPSTGDKGGEAPLPYCPTCHAHYLPGKTCECRTAGNIAHALP